MVKAVVRVVLSLRFGHSPTMPSAFSGNRSVVAVSIPHRYRGTHLVFDATPKPLNKNVVISPTPTVHGDGDGFPLENAREVITGELATPDRC